MDLQCPTFLQDVCIYPRVNSGYFEKTYLVYLRQKSYLEYLGQDQMCVINLENKVFLKPNYFKKQRSSSSFLLAGT